MVVHRDLTNSIEDWRLLDDYEAALRDLLHFYDRARGVIGHGEGWTAADVLRLEQIRMLAYPAGRTSPSFYSRSGEARGRTNESGKPPKPRKARKMRQNARKPEKGS